MLGEPGGGQADGAEGWGFMTHTRQARCRASAGIRSALRNPAPRHKRPLAPEPLTGEEPDSRLGLPRPYFKAGVACLAMTKPIKETNRDGEKSVARSKAPATS